MSFKKASLIISQYDGRNRLSNFWAPTLSRKPESVGEQGEDGHDLLLRAGFLRQAHSGIFHMLPLGLRVLDKIERLIDKHMQRIGASKTSLSSLSSQDLWRKSGRLDGRNAELFQVEDRKKAKFLLAPTHEEEITTIVKDSVQSYKDLPLRLYQVSRKYRDEARPRQGLLRGREFIMKDLYTFDESEPQAMMTYEDVRAAYKAFLEEFSLPYLVASADSGNMGGSHSHEYHFASPRGEDTVIKCSACDLSINEELYLGRDHETNHSLLDNGRADSTAPPDDGASFEMWIGQILQPGVTGVGSTSDNLTAAQQPRTFVQVFHPKASQVNMHALKRLIPNLDTTRDQHHLDEPPRADERVLSFRDPRLSDQDIKSSSSFWNASPVHQALTPTNIERAPFWLTKAQSSDRCPSCGTVGSLTFQRAVEIGHTFHLGSRYSKPLKATVKDQKNQVVHVEMGCHGIGVSRIIGAVVSLLADDKGLNWPVAIAPFSVLIIGTKSASEEDLHATYDNLNSAFVHHDLDVAIDDRERPIGWKLNDADLIGYPFIVVLGKSWLERGTVELQCRRLRIKEEAKAVELADKICEYRKQL